MQTDFLIIGQGLCGSWLSFWLNQAGADFLVIDNNHVNSATKVASGIINPVTGRRMVKTWMADELLPFAFDSYTLLGEKINEVLITKTELIDFFSSPDRRLSFEKRSQEFESYLNWPEDEHQWLSFFNYPFGFGIVSPVYHVHLQDMLVAWRLYLGQNKCIVNEKFESEHLVIKNDSIEYKNIKARKIIMCDGIAVMEQSFFRLLPFAFNKGEALVIDVPGLTQKKIFKKTNTITPWKDDLFWVGSTYNRDYKDDQPSKEFYDGTIRWLNEFLKLPYTVVDHLAAIRPTTVERRPFAGLHPGHNNVGILNGMGTKGVSIAPFLAKQLCDHLLHDAAIIKTADVTQYTRILQRS